MMLSGKEVLPLVEGGKGVAVSTGESAGAFAAAGAIGTFSGVNPDFYDENGNRVVYEYQGKTRGDRQKELLEMSITGAIAQAKIAHERSNGQGRLHMNVLWEMGGAQPILEGVLSKVSDLVHGVTCGAGMPYKVAEIASRYKVYYYPIVSSARAFNALFRRSYHKFQEWLGGVVYEDPWLAGGHNGLSNSEDPLQPQDPYPRVKALRDKMREFGLGNIPIIMAGGVWYLRDWKDWIDNKELGPIVFQFGTRPLLTQESEISAKWKKRLLTLKKGDIALNKFSPTGFYSSAVRNEFIQELYERSDRQIPYSMEKTEELNHELALGPRGRPVFVKEADRAKALEWIEKGFNKEMKTPDNTLIFVDPDRFALIRKNQIDCMGCLSACAFSNWSENEAGTTGRRADPRSFCIQKTLQDIAHDGSIDNNLMFAGHAAYKFAEDPFYANGFIPTIKQLVERIQTGD